MRAGPGDIAATYQRQAAAFARARGTQPAEGAVFEAVLRRMRGRRVLDLGCGPGAVAAVFAARGCRVTGVDVAPAMLALFRARVAGGRAVRGTMDRVRLGRRFDAILAWDSFFHLSPAAQARAFATFRAHAAPGAVLLFNTGTARGTAIGRVGSEPVFHASLSPADYRKLLANHGFRLEKTVHADPSAGGRTWWRARFG